tara:strand:- start:958 stop:1125 length:168 start_codon:yes stop_codon:yes gene_type:complete
VDNTIRKNSRARCQLYLEAEVLDYFAEKAKAKGVELNALVNDLSKKDIALIEGVK